MSFLDWFKRKAEDTPSDFDPRRSGSLIVAAGGPGTGKTLLLFRIALKAAYDAGLPFVAEDPNGDLSVYHEAAIDLLKSKRKLSEDDADLLAWLKDRSQVRIYSRDNVKHFSGVLEKYRRDAAKSKSVRKPRVYAFIDEGGSMRRDSESFWNVAASFRNAGITAYTTVHREKDIHPVGRQAIRCVLLFRGYEGEVEFFGVKIDAMDTTAPMSPVVCYIDAFDREVKRWNSVEAWDDPPFCMVEPVQPTNVKKELMRI